MLGKNKGGKNTDHLMKKQDHLMKQMKDLKPMLDQAENLLDKFSKSGMMNMAENLFP